MTNEIFTTIIFGLNFSLRYKTPVILQSEAAEYGIVCLAMVCGHYGLDIDLFSFRQRFGSASRGVTMMSLSKTVDHAGLKGRALSLDLSEIRQLKLPCILHWRMNHYVVLTKVRRSSFTIHDPVLGKRVIGNQEMSNYFTGIALELWSDQSFQQEKAKSRLRLSDLMRNIIGLKSTLLKIFTFSIVVEAISLLLPIGTQLVTDHVIMAHDQSLLSVIYIGLVFLTLFRTFISMLRTWTSLTLNTLTNIQQKTTLFDHLTGLPLSFFEKHHLEDIQSRFSSLDTIRSTFTNSIVSSIIDSIMTIGLLIILILYGDWPTWVVASFTLCYAIMRLATYRFYRRVAEEQVIKGARSNSYFMESLYSISTIKVLSLKERHPQHWLNINIEACNAGIKQTRLDTMFGGIDTFITTIDQVAVLWLSAIMVIDDNMTLGMFTAFNAYRGRFSQRTSSLIDLCMQLRMPSLHNEHLSEIVSSGPEQEPPTREAFSADSGAELGVKNLCHQHDPFSQPIFSNLNITVEPRESVALIGPSGVDKTTLLKVMCGLLSPANEDVLADNLDTAKIGLNGYRHDTACVLQEDRLFSGSLIDNISGFEDNADIDFVMECTRRCNIYDEIMKMLMDYEAIVGKLGLGISGRQKQRILIARALYRKSSILLMDEATSHLNLKNESVISQPISALSITRIIVAHRPSAIVSADRAIDLSQTKTVAPA